MPTTRFICTIGPKTLNRESLHALRDGGMNIARVNGAHGSIDDVERMIRALQKDLPEGVQILLDLPGNKVRTEGITEPITLDRGDVFILRPDMLTYRPLYRSLATGQRISAADGSILLDVTKIEGEDIHTVVIAGGQLSNRKGINCSGVGAQIPFDFERDTALLNLAIETGIDYVGLSFVRRVEHVRRVRAQLLESRCGIVAKVETAEAVADVDEVLASADIIMIDRGDLEADVGRENVPLITKDVIARAQRQDVPVIVASQFLTSMLQKPLPFMAEVSDISNAVLDGADILMLSEETAIGDYPIECIETMKTVALAAEFQLAHRHEAIILAAGPSNGFGALTTNKHKCMLDVGGSTIIEHILESLKSVGIPDQRTTLITGHSHQQLEHYLRASDFDGRFLHNPWYQTTNIASSYWMARATHPHVLVYGDIIFDTEVLADLLAAPQDIVLVVDERTDFDHEDEKVIVENGLLQRASKEIALDQATGEFIGLAKFSAKGAELVWNEVDALIKKGEMMSFLTVALESLAQKGVPISTVATQGRPWSDNDTLADLGQSREQVYPAIRERQSSPRKNDS